MSRLIDENTIIKMLNTMDRYTSEELTLCDTDETFPKNEVFIVDDVFEGLDELPSAQPEPCEDAVPRASVEYICRKNTVSTNPYEHEHHEKFIKFMDDPEIADFGRWQHSNGFNTALVAVKCDLDEVPSVTPKQRTGKWILDRSGAYCCSECMEPCAGYVMMKPRDKFCKMCGAKMEVTE